MVKQYEIPQDSDLNDLPESVQQYEAHLEYRRNVLKHIIDVGASLRLGMDIDTLLKRVCVAACSALRFRHATLYLHDDAGYFRVLATMGVSAAEEEYLHQHPLPEALVARLISEEYRISDSYFFPAEAPLWKDEYICSFFIVVDDSAKPPALPSPLPSSPGTQWDPCDLMVVPLVSGDNTLLGFLTPDAPLDGLRPTAETITLFELFANQAAVVIEGARLYEEARRSSEERAALIEIGRALSTPDALRDLQTVYQTIYEQVRRMMPADAFFVSRYSRANDKLTMDYLIDEGKIYPGFDYGNIELWVRQLLLEGGLFSTPQQYSDFIGKDSSEDIISGERVSESLLFVPIRYGEEVIGMLSAQSYQAHAYTQRHRETLMEIGVQAGIAITNARMYTELREALKQAQESERLKNHFLMTASHELRTPLTAVQGYLELLGDFGHALDDDSKDRFLSNARRACEELVLLLGNVMDASRVDQDRVTLNFTSVHVAQAVQSIIEILEPIVAREERTVGLKIADDLNIWVDDLRLRQILLNLVGNALKYAPPPTGIAISAESVSWDELLRRVPFIDQQPPLPASGQFVVIAIRDWGPGVALEDQPRLFSKFMRLTGAINSLQRGAGLGLYLCRQLTEAMGGHIWMESEGIDGEGATFFVALPRC
jgi:signal transduction histidine kinase